MPNRFSFMREENLFVSNAALLGILLGALTPVFSQEQAAPAAAATGTPTVSTVAPPLNHRRLSPEHAYARVYCIVPIVGSGSFDDPRRPMFAPLPPTAKAPADRTGIIAYQFQPSDDGKMALVEFVAVSRAGLAAVLTSTNPNVLSFERGQHLRQEIEEAFQKHKKSFSFSKFMPMRAQ